MICKTLDLRRTKTHLLPSFMYDTTGMATSGLQLVTGPSQQVRHIFRQHSFEG
jgi:hypothetical protein